MSAEQAAAAALADPAETDRVANRIIGFDLARAFAIFGMITVNYRASLSETGEAAAWLTSLAGQVNGRAAALFVFLAGIGISLLSRASRASGEKADIAADRKDLLRRALFLLVIGFWFRTHWEYDILHFYGVYLIIAAIMMTASNRWLIALAGLTLIVFPLLYYVLPTYYGISFWATTSEFSFRGIATDLFFQGYHPVAPWIAFMLFGMVIGRLDLRDTAVRRRLFIGGVVLALAAETLAYVMLDMGVFKLAAGLSPRLDLEEASQIMGSAPYPPMPLFVAVGTGWAMAVVSFFLWAGDRLGERWFVTPFVHAGQLALTIYILHGTLGIWAIGWAGYKPHQSLEWILGYSAVFYAAMVIAATLWRRRFERGPVEAIMRRLTDSWASEITPQRPRPANSA